jgi:hypothetical protein
MAPPRQLERTRTPPEVLAAMILANHVRQWNIERYEGLLLQEADPDGRLTIAELLAEERARAAPIAGPEGLGPADRPQNLDGSQGAPLLLSRSCRFNGKAPNDMNTYRKIGLWLSLSGTVALAVLWAPLEAGWRFGSALAMWVGAWGLLVLSMLAVCCLFIGLALCLIPGARHLLKDLRRDAGVRPRPRLRTGRRSIGRTRKWG